MNLIVFSLSLIAAIICIIGITTLLLSIFKKSNRKENYYIICIFIIVLVVAIPFIINEMYKHGEGYITMWDASDVLNFYGMIIASFTTIVGVFLSIRYTHSNYLEDTRKRVLPLFNLQYLKKNCTIDVFGDLDEYADEEIVGYEEYKLDRIFILVGKNIEYKTKLSKEQQIAAKTGFTQTKNYNEISIGIANIGYIPF